MRTKLAHPFLAVQLCYRLAGVTLLLFVIASTALAWGLADDVPLIPRSVLDAPAEHDFVTISPDGKSLGVWGGPGRAPGKLHSPWALAVDSRGRVHVVDSENHRVQRIRF